MERRPIVVWDSEGMIQALEDDHGFMENLIRCFLEDAGKGLVKIRGSLSEKNFESLRRTAHSLKGASGYLHAHRFSAAAFSLEGAGQKGDLEEAERVFDLMKEEFTVLAEKLKDWLQEERNQSREFCDGADQ